MKMQGRTVGGSLYIYLSGELDEHSVSGVREETDRLIDEHAGLSRAVIDLTGVRFMDSTGIGFLIGRYRRLKKYNMEMYLDNPDVNADKILSLSGVYAIMPKLKESV